MLKAVWLVVCGAVFGIANVIPGVSGGTLAVVMNVYDGLIDSIANFRKHMKQSIFFLLPFLAGAGAAILLFSKIVKMLLETHPMQVNFFFIGLMLGSLPLIGKKAFAGAKLKAGSIIGLLAGIGVMVIMFFLSPSESGGITETLTVSYFFLMLISGAVAAVTMIIPGISGSLMLLVIGVYNSVIAAVSNLNIMILIPFAIGVIIGFLAGTKLVAWCLSRAPKLTYCVIFGLVLGSLLPVFAESGFRADTTGLISVGIMVIGALIAYFMSREKSENKLEDVKE